MLLLGGGTRAKCLREPSACAGGLLRCSHACVHKEQRTTRARNIMDGGKESQPRADLEQNRVFMLTPSGRIDLWRRCVVVTAGTGGRGRGHVGRPAYGIRGNECVCVCVCVGSKEQFQQSIRFEINITLYLYLSYIWVYFVYCIF